MTNYIVNNNNVRIFGDEEVNIQPNLPLGTYLVKENPMTGELYLEKTVNFTKPAKIYGDCEFQSERIITTFRDRPKNTGVLLNGAKGSGKTFLAKYISYKLLNENYSTIVINEIFNPTKLSLLLQTISEPCVIIFDEFEKIYQPSKNDNNNPQNGLLSLLDGLFQTKKLFIFTCNDDNNISNLMKNRPGRVYYKLEFKGINDKAIEEYCEEKLINKKYLSQIFSIKKMIKDFTFDILQTIVEEVNRYDETPLDAVKMLNVTPQSLYTRYSISVKPLQGQKIINYEKTIWMNPLSSDEESVWIKRYGTELNIDDEDSERKIISDIAINDDDDDDEEDNDEKTTDYVIISLETLISTNKNTYVYNSGGYQITLTKKEIDTTDMWRYAV